MRPKEDDCQACGTCVEFCPFEALSLGETTVLIDEATCMGCGVCVSKCETGALRLERSREKGEPLDIRALTAGGDGCPTAHLLAEAAHPPASGRRAR